MLSLMRGYEEEDRVLAVKKAKEVAAMKLEILAANDKAIADRKALREKDKEVQTRHRDEEGRGGEALVCFVCVYVL
jgi:hypothetical protein